MMGRRKIKAVLIGRKDVLNKAEATSRYLARQPLVLSYVEVYRPSEKREIRLVYRPVPRPGTQAAHD